MNKKNFSHNEQKPEAIESSTSAEEVHPFWDFWAPILFTLSLYLGVRHYIAEARYIPSGSMLPGLQIQDRLIIEKLTLRYRNPYRGEVVVFKSPYSFDPVLLGSAKHTSSSLKCALLNFPLISIIPGLTDVACDAYIKRVVAVAGDHVVITKKGELILNGNKQIEPYVSNLCSLVFKEFNPCRTLSGHVPEDHVLVLGDNRANSWDGRFWPGGNFLPTDQILGRAVWRFWPLNRLGAVKSF